MITEHNTATAKPIGLPNKNPLGSPTLSQPLLNDRAMLQEHANGGAATPTPPQSLLNAASARVAALKGAMTLAAQAALAGNPEAGHMATAALAELTAARTDLQRLHVSSHEPSQGLSQGQDAVAIGIDDVSAGIPKLGACQQSADTCAQVLALDVPGAKPVLSRVTGVAAA